MLPQTTFLKLLWSMVMQPTSSGGIFTLSFMVQVCLHLFYHLQYPPALHNLSMKEKGSKNVQTLPFV
jgi:hypothetical protein